MAAVSGSSDKAIKETDKSNNITIKNRAELDRIKILIDGDADEEYILFQEAKKLWKEINKK